MKWIPLYWIGEQAVILDDVTEYGLVRRHIVRRGEFPDVVQFLRGAPSNTWHTGYVDDDDGFCHLWICWKDPAQVKKVTDWGW